MRAKRAEAGAGAVVNAFDTGLSGGQDSRILDDIKREHAASKAAMRSDDGEVRFERWVQDRKPTG